MTRFLQWSSRAYETLLILYPRELRQEFGSDMALVFDEDVRWAYRTKGALGVIQVWWCAAVEIVRIAVPSHCTNPHVAVPAITFALSVAMTGTQASLAYRHSGFQKVLLREAIGYVVLLPSLAQSAIAFASVCLSRASQPVLLRLGARQE
jgi:hypothetical protein